MARLLDYVYIVGTTPRFFNGKRRYVSTGALNFDNIDEDQVEMVDYETRPTRANLVAECGDVLFAKMQGTAKTIMLNNDTAKNIYSTGFYALRANEKITSQCLYYLITSNQFLNQKDKYCSGATQKAITAEGLKKINISIPEKGAQEEVAKVLSKISYLLVLRRQQIENLDQLVKSRFIEMFGDPGINPYGFDKQILKNTCNVVTGNTPSRTVERYYGNYIEWIKTDNIVTGQLNPTIATEYLSEEGIKVGRTVEKGTILMACIAGSVASIGRVCITDRKVAFNQQINAVIPQKYDPLFLYVMLQISKDYLVQEINMALKGILSKSKLEEKEFIVPPMNYQVVFSTFVAQIDKSKFEIQQSREKLETLKKALMQKYFG